MTPTARLVAVVIGIVGLLFAAAGLVREVVLAAHGATDWPLSAWWERVTGGPSAATTIAAVLTGLLAVALLVLAARQLGGRRRRGPSLVQFAGERGWARVDIGALERALCRRLEAEFPGLRTRGLELTKRTGGWRARLEAELPARDLVGVQARAHEVLASDLDRMAGMRLDTLDVVAWRLTAPPAASV